jgi:hypothetical protein
VPAVGHDQLLGAGDPLGEVGGACGAADEVGLARDDDRRRLDARERRPQIELVGIDALVEPLERVGVGQLGRDVLLDERAGALVVVREVERELANREVAQLLRRLELARELLFERLLGVLVPGLVRVGGLQALHLLGMEPRKRVGEDEPPHERRMLGRVRRRDDATVGMAEQVELLDVERYAQRLHVGRVLVGGVRLRVRRALRLGSSTRVEQDQREQLVEPAQVTGEVPRGEPGAARMAHEQRPVAEAVVLQRQAVGAAKRFGHGRSPSTIRSRPARSRVIVTPS